MQGVILAAGRGSRLGSLAANRSKAMLPVLDRPLVGRVLDGLALAGVSPFILVGHPGDEALRQFIEREIRDRREKGKKSEEGAETGAVAQAGDLELVFQTLRRGVGDALAAAAPAIQGDFALSACDNLVPEADLSGMVRRWQAGPRCDALLAVLRLPAEEISHSSAVLLDGERVTRIVEKPAPGQAPSDLASLPLYLFTPRILEFLPALRPSPRGELELQDAIAALIAAGGDVRAYPVSSRQTVTTPADLLAINRHFLAQKPLACTCEAEIGAGVRLFPPVYVESGARIGVGCTLGPEVYVEAGGRVGEGARVERSLVLAGGVVLEGREALEMVVAAEIENNQTRDKRHVTSERT